MNHCSDVGSFKLANIEGDLTSSALSLLNQKLPPYVINCPLSSGFDEIEVLCSMDSYILSEKLGISIEKIKVYSKEFTCRYPDDGIQIITTCTV